MPGGAERGARKTALLRFRLIHNAPDSKTGLLKQAVLSLVLLWEGHTEWPDMLC